VLATASVAATLKSRVVSATAPADASPFWSQRSDILAHTAATHLGRITHAIAAYEVELITNAGEALLVSFTRGAVGERDAFTDPAVVQPSMDRGDNFLAAD